MKWILIDFILCVLLLFWGSCVLLGGRLSGEPAPRSRAVVERFQRLTGYPAGRPGYVVDHQIPLCAGGPDVLENLQWQTLTESRLKDHFERALCAALTRQGYHVTKIVKIPPAQPQTPSTTEGKSCR